MRSLFLFVSTGMLLCSFAVHAGIVVHVGDAAFTGWDSVSWGGINSLNDSDDGEADHLDFVGDAVNPGAYWGMDDSFVYFRMRLDADTADTGTFSDSHFILIDVEGYGGDAGLPDFSFCWDSKGTPVQNHELEMQVFSSGGTTWDSVQMDDIDGDPSKKAAADINGDGRSGDGYVRSVDGQTTVAFGDTTFLDYAVSLDYISTYVPALQTNGPWKIQFGSLANATDHNPIDVDVAGGINPTDSVTLGWSDAIAIPEPVSAGLILLFGGGFLALKRIFHE